MSPKGAKVERNGKTAVIYSPGYGSGWSSWNPQHCPKMLFDPEIVRLLEMPPVKEVLRTLERYISETYPAVFCPVDQLRIYWAPTGEAFEIEVFDGYERVIELGKPEHWIA